VARKPSGEIGITKITSSSDGQMAELVHVELPDDKEGLERYFADRFVFQINKDGALEHKIVIDKQNDTTDLDFNISGSRARYLELAEIAPYSEEVGKAALEGQWISVYDFSKWIWKQLVEKKQKRYADVCTHTILLLYTARWEFFVSQTVLHCLIWSLQNKGCRFHAVYLMQSGGEDLNLVYCLYPNDHAADHPRKFRDNRYLNAKPGTDRWDFSS